MLILTPVILLLIASSVLMTLGRINIQFKYSWIIALGGSVLGFISILFWRVEFPSSITLLPWQPLATFNFSPTWISDVPSMTYALGLSILSMSIMLIEVVHKDQDPFGWAGILLLVSLSLLCVTSGNPLTFIISWSLIDFAELTILLWFIRGGNNIRKVFQGYIFKVVGMGVVLTAIIMNSTDQIPITFEKIGQNSGLLIILGVGLRMGLLPLHRPHLEGKRWRRGLGTTLGITSAVSSLALLPHIPNLSTSQQLFPLMLSMASILALYSGWMWMRASEELNGQPFWILGTSTFSVASIILGNSQSSIGWGMVLLLVGGLIFSYSARDKKNLAIVLIAVFGISSLPFSVTAYSWMSKLDLPWYLWLLWVPAQCMLIVGLLRHTFHPGEISLESQFGWVKVLYTIGLTLIVAFLVFLGIINWLGDRQLGLWWISIPVVVFSAALALVNFRYLGSSSRNVTQWGEVIPTSWLFKSQDYVYAILKQTTHAITSTLEGEGGVFWSFLLLVLILSLIAAGTP